MAPSERKGNSEGGGIMEDRFVAEPMLGKLAKWLRLLGHDVLYQRSYEEEELTRLLGGGRRLVSRRTAAQVLHPGVLLLRSDHVSGQLRELKEKGGLQLDRSRFFTRCLLCNVTLTEADLDSAKATLPEYVFHENPSRILFCPECGRFYWPGTHRARMLKQLEDWGL